MATHLTVGKTGADYSTIAAAVAASQNGTIDEWSTITVIDNETYTETVLITLQYLKIIDTLGCKWVSNTWCVQIGDTNAPANVRFETVSTSERPQFLASARANIHVACVNVVNGEFSCDYWDFGATQSTYGRCLLISSGNNTVTISHSTYLKNGSFDAQLFQQQANSLNLLLDCCDFDAPTALISNIEHLRIKRSKISVNNVLAAGAVDVENSIIKSTSSSVALVSTSTKFKIRNSVFVGDGANFLKSTATADDVFVQNCIITGFNTVFDTQATFSPQYSILWQNVTNYAGQATEGPGMIYASPDLDADFRPNSDSPAWGAGEVSGLTTDIIGNIRPYPGDNTESIGAYERTWTPPPIPVRVDEAKSLTYIYASGFSGEKVEHYDIFDAFPAEDKISNFIQALAMHLFSDRGWWGDSFRDVKIGSKLFKLYHRPVSSELLREAVAHVEESLKWLTLENHCKNYIVEGVLEEQQIIFSVVVDFETGQQITLKIPSLIGAEV